MEDFLNWFSGYAMNKILPAVIMLVAGILAIRLLVVLAEKLMKRISMEAVAISLIKTTLRVALYLLLILIVVSKLGVDITGMVALASVLTLAISLSLQNALTNLISGFTLLRSRFGNMAMTRPA
jgi:small conductance mechanosensitive channel